ncbi:hypothetical protein MKW98_015044 [Papaver atlanticum]|uniref:Uncharacterized protein n=1 Tax=Papaver atlanticum TaxID=357466 RepID=A0AAD4X9F8_9MAGN|nr:hypothetical protein MKW98_015044 [Papaver atlanticum]
MHPISAVRFERERGREDEEADQNKDKIHNLQVEIDSLQAGFEEDSISIGLIEWKRMASFAWSLGLNRDIIQVVGFRPFCSSGIGIEKKLMQLLASLEKMFGMVTDRVGDVDKFGNVSQNSYSFMQNSPYKDVDSGGICLYFNFQEDKLVFKVFFRGRCQAVWFNP